LVFLVITRRFRSTATSQRHIRHRSRRGVSSAERSTSTQRFSGLACEPSLVRSIQSVSVYRPLALRRKYPDLVFIRYATPCVVLVLCRAVVSFRCRLFAGGAVKIALKNSHAPLIQPNPRYPPSSISAESHCHCPGLGLDFSLHGTVPYRTIPTVSHQSVTVRYLPV
jgi:hypothetical protein